MAGQKREARLRARRPGHPRLSRVAAPKYVDARHKAGHDELHGHSPLCYNAAMFPDRQPIASRVVLDDRSRLPWRFFGRLTTAALAV
ncbi:MAG: hypothetical protein E6G82_05130 [Alphaproteobacteria bacterium]|nr:MAG: hypothetical protein E6G82_05130 [Alphaproteobacteria bacterium]